MDDDDLMAERRRAEASQWFARLKTLPVSQGTLKEFFAWRRQKPNADAFQEAERFWTEAEKVGQRPSILRAVEAATARRVARRRFPRLIAVPALVALLAMIGVATYLMLKPPEYRTKAGETQTIALADGSHLRLNTETDVRVRYDSSGRHLILRDGEALFTVAHGDPRPFTVDAGAVTVTATGTKFNVSRLGGTVVVTLVEGHVRVRTPDGKAIAMTAGQQWRPNGSAHPVRRVDIETAVAWTQGRLIFDDTPLVAAIDEVNRYGGAPVILDAPGLADERISGSFDTGDAPSFATAVAAFLSLRERRDEAGRIHLDAEKRAIQKNIVGG